MKIHGHGQPPAAGITDADGAQGVSGGVSETNATGKTTESGRAFADKLETTKAASGAMATAPVAGGIAVADLAAALRAGKLSGRGAVDQLVERIMDRLVARQLGAGADAPAAVREQVKAALEDALENDPLLAEKLRDLG